MDRKALTHEEYLASDVWRCLGAPINLDIPLQVINNTGAHHWIEIKSGLWYCKYCCDARKLPADWNSYYRITTIEEDLANDQSNKREAIILQG